MSRPASSVVQRAERFVERPDISARSLLVTVWGDTIAPITDEVWLSELFALLAPLPYSERLLRTSLSRLQNDDWVNAQRDGRRSRYELTAAAKAQTLGAEGRIYGDRPSTSAGRWQLVIADKAPASDVLRAAGYATLGPNLFGRPLSENSPLADPTPPELFGSDDVAVATATFEPYGPLTGTASVIEAFDLGAVAADYDAFLTSYGGLDPKDTSGLEPADAFALRAMMMHEYRRIRLKDPLAPRDVLDGDWVGDRAHDLIAALYRSVLAASWRWAAETLQTADRPRGSHVAARFVPASS